MRTSSTQRRRPTSKAARDTSAPWIVETFWYGGKWQPMTASQCRERLVYFRRRSEAEERAKLRLGSLFSKVRVRNVVTGETVVFQHAVKCARNRPKAALAQPSLLPVIKAKRERKYVLVRGRDFRERTVDDWIVIRRYATLSGAVKALLVRHEATITMNCVQCFVVGWEESTTFPDVFIDSRILTLHEHLYGRMDVSPKGIKVIRQTMEDFIENNRGWF